MKGRPERGRIADQIRSELLKQRSTRANLGLSGAMLALVALAVLLHGYALPATALTRRSDQVSLLVGWGAVLGVVFAGLAGAISITAEVRHGTIRPTLIVTPRRSVVVAGKAGAAMATGARFGAAATTLAAATGCAVLAGRGFPVLLGGGDYAQLIAGGTAAGALWAMIGLGTGAIVRSQVPTLIGMTAWLLFVEGQLVGNLPSVGRYLPGALGQAVSGLDAGRPVSPWAAVALLGVHAAVVAYSSWLATSRRDFA